LAFRQISRPSSWILRPEEEAKMVPAYRFSLHARSGILLILLISAGLLARQPQSAKFYDVQVSKDEIYSYSNLKFAGDFTVFESPKGFLSICRTDDGVTIVMVLGEGTVTIEAPEAVQEKFKTVLGGYPLKTTFKTLYMRLHPKEFEETFGKQPLSKVSDEGAFTAAKQLFDDSFMRSYHAGAKAMFPPYMTRVMEFNTPNHGLVSQEEGYWLILRKYSPYGSVYPKDFVNPKQK
jgi:hypothetical protein